ncbi:MAG: hypothetical protein IJE01_03045 [Clostridia bacterium]|nr:hypothetical protein [Clostridia bacterium]
MQDTLQLNPQVNDNNKTTRRRFFCPSCGKHTVLWLLPTTEIKNLPIKCKRCGTESIVNIAPLPES